MINKSYISRQSLIDACNAYSESPWANDYGGYSKGVRDALRAIKDCAQMESEDATIGIGLPSADVVPVMHGKWKPGKEISRTMLGDETLAIDYDAFYCSACGRRYKEYVLIYNYCPNCGARMDGDHNG